MMDMGQDATSVVVAEVGAGMGVRNRFERTRGGTSLVVQWLRLCSQEQGAWAGWGTKILHTACCGQKGERTKRAQMTFHWNGAWW